MHRIGAFLGRAGISGYLVGLHGMRRCLPQGLPQGLHRGRHEGACPTGRADRDRHADRRPGLRRAPRTGAATAPVPRCRHARQRITAQQQKADASDVNMAPGTLPSPKRDQVNCIMVAAWRAWRQRPPCPRCAPHRAPHRGCAQNHRPSLFSLREAFLQHAIKAAARADVIRFWGEGKGRGVDRGDSRAAEHRVARQSNDR